MDQFCKNTLSEATEATFKNEGEALLIVSNTHNETSELWMIRDWPGLFKQLVLCFCIDIFEVTEA